MIKSRGGTRILGIEETKIVTNKKLNQFSSVIQEI